MPLNVVEPSGLLMTPANEQTEKQLLEAMKAGGIPTLEDFQHLITRLAHHHILARVFLLDGRAHGRDQRVAGELPGSPLGHHLAVLHDGDTVAMIEDIGEEMRDEDRAHSARDFLAHEGEELLCRHRIER